MKKIFFLIMLMILMLCSYTASADDGIFIKEGKLGTVFSDGEFHTGLFGRSDGHECQYALGQNQETANKIYIYSDISKFEGYKYYTLETNFVPVDGLNSITLQTKGQANISQNVTSGWKEKQWNNVRVIYEVPDENSVYGYTSIYVNGFLLLDRSPNKSILDPTQLRLSFNGVNGDTLVKLYVEKYYCYAYNENPYGPSSPVLINDDYKILLSKIYCKKNVTKAKDIKFLNADVTVYDDENLDNILYDDFVSEKNIVVVQNDENNIFYYEVQFLRDDGRLFDSSLDFTDDMIEAYTKNGIYEIIKENGIPYAICFTNQNNYSNVEYIYNVPFARYYDAIEIRFEIMPQDISSVQFMTNLGTVLSERAYVLDNSIINNEWNTLKLIFHRKDQSVTFYANDKIISKIYCDNLGVDESYESIRFLMVGKENTSCLLKERNVFYLLEDKNATEGFLISDKAAASLLDLNLYVSDNINTADLKDIYKEGYIAVDGFGNVKKGDEILTTGDYVIYQFDQLRRFRVKKLEKSKFIKLNETDEETVVIVSDKNDSYFYSVEYSGNKLLDVKKNKIDKDKISSITINKGELKTKLFLWTTWMEPIAYYE